MSWVWLDGVDQFEKEKRVKAWKRWDHSFPQTYLVEFIAQAGAILLGAESEFREDVVFTKVEKVEFLGRPRNGERLEIEVEADGLRREGGWFSGWISQRGEKIFEGRVLLMNVGKLLPDRGGPITFPEQLIRSLAAAKKPVPEVGTHV